MKIIAGIVSYNPDIEILIKCVRSVPGDVDKILIVDNGSENIDDVFKALAGVNNIVLINNQDNYGIAKALNQIFQFAYDSQYDYVLCLDQDSVVPENLIDCYRKVIKDSKVPNVGIVCPRIHDRVTNKTWPDASNNCDYVQVKRCITSGSLNSVEVWKVIGGFDEYLFIDEVDHDFSYRVINSGYKIILCVSVTIDHQIGNTEIRYIFGKPIYIRNHSAFRKYYMVRNMIYVGKKQCGRIRVKDIIHAMLFTLKTFIYERDKKDKVVACIRGFSDGCRKSMKVSDVEE